MALYTMSCSDGIDSRVRTSCASVGANWAAAWKLPTVEDYFMGFAFDETLVKF